ncbi:MAG: M24 family metallopeptidase, partial [Desulfotignum sp.]
MKNKAEKIGRNSPCPCGSGKKYKNCCRNIKKEISVKETYKQQYDIILKTSEQVEGIRRAGMLLMQIMNGVEKMIAPGLVTEEINTFVHEQTIRAGAIPAPLNYRGFPKSVCVSVNEVICHGIPGKRVLQDG